MEKGHPERTKVHLQTLSELLTTETAWTPESIKAHVWEYAEKEGRGEVLWPFRFALTGKERSPDPFTVAAILGKDKTLERLEKAVSAL